MTYNKAVFDGTAFAGSAHNHDGTYAPAAHNHDASYAAAAHNHDGAYAAIGHSHPGTWTYLVLDSDFTTSSASAVDVTGLGFAPAASTRYEFEAVLLCRTATATVGPRPGVAWPTGGTDGVADIYITSAAGTEVQQHGNINAATLAPVGGLPNTTQSWPARIAGLFLAGASPSGNVRVQMASETAGTNVTVKAGSILKYRTY